MAHDDDDDPEPDEGARPRLELLALLLVVAAVGLVAQFVLQGFAITRQSTPGPFDWRLFLGAATVGGYVPVSVLLVLAFGLVVAPAGPPGRRGRVVLNALSVVGVAVATLAVVAIEEGFRARPSSDGGSTLDVTDHTVTWLGRASLVAGFLPSLAMAGTVAFLSWRLLNELVPPPGPWVDDDEVEVEEG